MSDTDDELAARLRPTLHGYYDAPGPTDVMRIVDQHPGGAIGFAVDCTEAARRWLTCRPVSAAGEANSLPPPTAS